jgi:hypothetical protein
MNLRQQSSTSYPFAFLLVSSTDHVTAVTGLGTAPAVYVSKNGAGFGAASGAVSELAYGWYAWAGDATDRATIGELSVHITGTGADPVDAKLFVVGFDPFANKADLVDAPSATAVASIKTNLGTIPASGNWSTAGAKMDLVDAPSATAVASIKTNLGTIPASGNWATVGAKMDLADTVNATGVASFKTSLGTVPASGNWNTTTPPTAGTIAGAVLDEVLGSHAGFITTLVPGSPVNVTVNGETVITAGSV